MFPKSTTASRREDRIANTRWLHKSCDAFMAQHPLGSEHPAIPYVQKPGVTYSVGRNAKKRQDMAARLAWRK